MLRRRKLSKKQPVADINIVPYVDVMLVLLVIFMITAPLLTEGVNVQLPQAQAKILSKEEQQPIVISVDEMGLYYLNIAEKPQQPLNPQALLTRVMAELRIAQEQKQQRTVLVKGDALVNYGKVVGAMVLLQQAGVDQVGLMTQTPPGVAG